MKKSTVVFALIFFGILISSITNAQESVKDMGLYEPVKSWIF
jgi:hypothetical protein